MPPEKETNRISGKKRTFVESLKKAYERFVKIRGNPREIALGFALGLFVGMSPTLGLQMAIAVFFAALFKLNKVSAAIGVWISNPFTAPFLYYLTYVAGARLLGINHAVGGATEISGTTFLDLLFETPEILWAATLGGIILGLPVAVSGYFFAFSAISKYQDDIKKKLAERRKKRAIKKKKKKKNKNKRKKK